jgi:hypothetical protein
MDVFVQLHDVPEMPQKGGGAAVPRWTCLFRLLGLPVFLFTLLSCI